MQYRNSKPLNQKRSRPLFVACLVLAPVLGGATVPTDVLGDDIIGLWLSEYQDGVIELFMHEDELRGRLVWIQHAVDENGNPQTDLNNPDPERRDDPIQGMTIVWGFERKNDEGTEWGGGWIYDPDNGKTYKCKIRLNEEEDVLDIRGYIFMSLFGRTTKWARVTFKEMLGLAERDAEKHAHEGHEH